MPAPTHEDGACHLGIAGFPNESVMPKPSETIAINVARLRLGRVGPGQKFFRGDGLGHRRGPTARDEIVEKPHHGAGIKRSGFANGRAIHRKLSAIRHDAR